MVSHLDLWWEDATASRFFRRLASLWLLIMFDKGDTGLSDRAAGDLSLERRMEDVRAVMRACDSSQAVLFGYSEGGPMSILFAATYPGSVTSLILAAASARWSPAPDYPCGRESAEMFESFEHLASAGWGDAMLAEIEQFLTGPPRGPGPDRVLTKILRQEMTGAMSAASIAGQHVRSQRGHLIKTTAHGIFATFDGPGRAIRCAAAIRDIAATHGSQARAGIHTGEVEVLGDQIAGTPVDITDRIAALARPAEILASRTVKDLVVGSAIAFAERGSCQLTGVPDRLPLFAVAGL